MVKKQDVINLAHKIANEYKKNNREIIHLIPLQYKIDDSSYVQNPCYMSGKKITSKFHVVSVATSVTKNIENCLKSCRLSVNNYILESYGAYLSATNERESNLGSLTIDFGGVSTSFCVIYEGKLVYCGHVKVGGMHITKDISKILNVDFDVAQQIKILNHSLIINPLEERELIKMKIDSFGDNFGLVKITKKELKEIITCRIEEIVELVKKDLSDNGYGPHIFNNIMLSGGVCGIIGIEKIVNEIFNKQSRVLYPTKIYDLPNQLNDPSFASVIGMLVYLQDIYKKEKNSEGFNSKGGLIKRFIDYLMSL
jgi:cell division protein FtsA